LPKEVDEIIAEHLTKIKKSNVYLTVPKIGEKNTLLKLVQKNIEITFFGDIQKVKDLKEKLRLSFMPNVIECFDISHLSGTHTVGSMVQFRNGKPYKSNYRRFKIKTVEGIDDFSSMAEVVKRRYKRLRDEGDNYPDLIVIDGGKGQLSSAVESLNELGINIPIISLAKQFEEIYAPGRSIPIVLNHKTDAIKLLQNIRDEAHRFAITYNRLLRKKSFTD